MTANTWVARLVLLPKAEREIIFEYLTGMDEAGPVPNVKWMRERVKERDLNAAKRTAREQHE